DILNIELNIFFKDEDIMDAEFAVIGLGAMGSMSIWQLAQRKKSVIGFEQFGVGHDRSATGGESRLFRTAYKEGEKFVPLLLDSRKLWRELESASKNSLLELNGGLSIGFPESNLIKNTMKSIKKYRIDHEILNNKAAKKRFPQHKLLNQEVMILDKESGFLRPELSVVSAVYRAKELGAKIHTYENIRSIKYDNEGVRILSNKKKYTVEKVLISAGPYIEQLLPQYGDSIKVGKIVMSWFATKSINKFNKLKYQIFIRENHNDKFFGTPTFDNSMVKIGLGEIYNKIENPMDLDNHVSIEELSKVKRIVSQYFNYLYSDPVRLSVHMDAYTPDNNPIIGKLLEQSNVVIAGGFSGHGFKMAPIMGKIASDLLIDDKTSYNINFLSPYRFF